MLLTKAGLRKIVIIAAIYFLIGSFSLTVGLGVGSLFRDTRVNTAPLIRLGVIAYVVGILSVFWGWYAEGKGKLLAKGNRLISRELNPAEFIREYDAQRESPGLVVCRPGPELLQLLMMAYDALNDFAAALAAADAQLAAATGKRVTRARIYKAALLYSYDRTEEAEAIFTEISRQRLGAVDTLIYDALLKADRAVARGDYRTAEAYCLKKLEHGFPRPCPLETLYLHGKLALLYERLGEREQALEHYRYCAENGGGTALRGKAAEALERLRGEA